jgi:hypothetical protein
MAGPASSTNLIADDRPETQIFDGALDSRGFS